MKKFIILILAGLLLPAFCFAYTYERTPTGSPVYNPVSFFIEWENLEELQGYCAPRTWWGFYVEKTGENFFSICIEENDLSETFEVNLPLGVWDSGVGLQCCNGELEYGTTIWPPFFEGAFEVVEEEEPTPPTGGIWTLPADFLASTTAYIGDIFGDIWVLVAFMIGFPLAFWVILKIENLTKNKDKTKFKRPKDLKEKNNWL